MSEFFTGINNRYHTSAFGRLSIPSATRSTYTLITDPPSVDPPSVPPSAVIGPFSGLSLVSNPDVNVFVFLNGQKLIGGVGFDYQIDLPSSTIIIASVLPPPGNKYEVYINGIPV